MKSDEDVRMISSEAPILFALACQMFITELTHRAAFHARVANRKTLQRADIQQVIGEVDIFDFLMDVIPLNEQIDKERLNHNQLILWQEAQNMKRMANMGQQPAESQVRHGMNEGESSEEQSDE